MAETMNMLRNVVRDEDPHTELLYNLMQVDEFRLPVLRRLFSARCASRTAHRDIGTQVKLNGNGRADLLIENFDVCAVLEIKVSESRGLTEKQPEGYLRFLAQKEQPERRLTFLVPKRWSSRGDCEKRLKAFSHPTIEAGFVHWEDLIEVLESSQLRDANPILSEFTDLLIDRYKTQPVQFSNAEVRMLFSEQTGGAVWNLYRLVEKIREKADVYKPASQRSEQESIYFKNAEGEEIFWIGIWREFWAKSGKPLCFGVHKSSPASARSAFNKSYRGQTEYFEGYTVGWTSEADLSAPDSVDRVWNLLAPVLEVVTKAGEPG